MNALRRILLASTLFLTTTVDAGAELFTLTFAFTAEKLVFAIGLAVGVAVGTSAVGLNQPGMDNERLYTTPQLEEAYSENRQFMDIGQLSPNFPYFRKDLGSEFYGGRDYRLADIEFDLRVKEYFNETAPESLVHSLYQARTSGINNAIYEKIFDKLNKAKSTVEKVCTVFENTRPCKKVFSEIESKLTYAEIVFDVSGMWNASAHDSEMYRMLEIKKAQGIPASFFIQDEGHLYNLFDEVDAATTQTMMRMERF